MSENAPRNSYSTPEFRAGRIDFADPEPGGTMIGAGWAVAVLGTAVGIITAFTSLNLAAAITLGLAGVVGGLVAVAGHIVRAAAPLAKAKA